MNLSYKSKLILALGLVYIIWGSTYLGVKWALHVFPPLLLTAVRFILGGSVLFAFTLARGHGWPTREQVVGASKLGILLSGFGTGAVAYGVNYVPSGVVALLVATLPVWTFLLDYAFFSHSKPGWLTFFGMFLGLMGMLFLLNPGQSAQSALPLFPTLIVFLGSISWALGSLISFQTPQPGALQSTALQMLAGGLFALTLSAGLEGSWADSFARLDSQAIWAMAYLIGIGSYVGYTAYIWLINHAPPLLTSTYAYVNPVVALFLGWALAHERLTSQTWVASGLILLGVLCMTIGKKTSKIRQTS